MHGFVTFEVFGQAQPRVLLQHERWDDQREKPSRLPSSENSAESIHSSSGSSIADSATLGSLERISEEELLTAERHDVVAWIEAFRDVFALRYLIPLAINLSGLVSRKLLSVMAVFWMERVVYWKHRHKKTYRSNS
ncbi:hypothetical protein G6F68_015414 [Rhizopus microsporus]|nr:hypothetical protein G6F68_015414 [Rhizopus microsporus]